MPPSPPPPRPLLSPLARLGLSVALADYFHIRPAEGRLLGHLILNAPKPIPSRNLIAPTRRSEPEDSRSAENTVRVQVAGLRRRFAEGGAWRAEVCALREAFTDCAAPIILRSRRRRHDGEPYGYWLSLEDASALLALAEAHAERVG